MSVDTATTHRDLAAEFSDWVGHSTTLDDEVTLPAVRRMAAMLDMDPMAFTHGSAIPPHWYSLFFTPNARRSEIGHDGHPRKGGFLPPIPLPRRMFVGRKVTFPGTLRVGDQAVKRSEIVGIEQKSGRSGTLVFLKQRHVIEVNGKAVVIEEPQVVYRDAPPANAKPSAASATTAPQSATWQLTQEMDPVSVFRYSALTWNGHRIHYDADYARREEGYPGCVMNGALTLQWVIDAVLNRVPGRRLAFLSARMVTPLFIGGQMMIAGSDLDNGSCQAWASDVAGQLAASCTFKFEDAQ